MLALTRTNPPYPRISSGRRAIFTTAPSTSSIATAYKIAEKAYKVRYMSENEFPDPLPVVRALTRLGRDLSLARRRRQFSQESMAERIGTSVATLRRLERGDPSVAVGTVARALFVLGEIERLGGLLDTATDTIGLSLMDEQLPKRIRRRRVTPESGAL